MFYLYIALYQEAKPIIRELKLKRSQTSFGFDLYENESMRLVLTGSGGPAAAAAVAASLAFFRAGDGDLLLNWGSCAAETVAVAAGAETVAVATGAEEATRTTTGKAGAYKVYLCQKLVDRVYRRTYYPDMMVRTSIPEACVITESEGWSPAADRRVCALSCESGGEEREGEDREVILHDMEAAAVYGAGSYFLSPDRMHFLKVVTDHGIQTFSGRVLSDAMEESAPVLLSYIETLQNLQGWLWERDGTGESLEAPENLKRIYDEFHCSEAMKVSVLQSVRYWTLAGIDYHARLRELRASGELPCRDRREGKKKFEQFRESLF